MNESLESRIAKAADKVARRFRRKHMSDAIAPDPNAAQRLFSRPHVNQADGHVAAEELIALLERWRQEHPRR